ncbi:winged helix DNA-binding domain-containing protein [Aeromicrobium duanguangcaii]|uniref:Winged helix DNA-binding domain-containing protein n=1 Tax=Aeromicrobium duanguangcaii TaxID=2968086 RepID=A0ABY5KEA5_9ACTN|nr:winged helix DNA-binding domain-containing protein [Aeromicrobium duanguangcaii]MCD9154576.1 winged helix DNA-binding domain-containing protein [Aeromicrobium duanguangcaii]MCL3838328.1 winged helix DNA-binding domain-containing protein [Aeromicrobium duanguangcaii]UUI68368.1 winged helix DNA-binding domain-containing protein [Aeromicrobium duanguangcaii]
MSPAQVRGERMARQRLIGEPFPDLATCVGTLGAVQFQEFEDSLWSLARRTKDKPSREAIATEIAEGSLVRHHVLRPTWHVVRVEDLGWMLDLTADRIRAQSRPQLRSTGLLEDRDRFVAVVGQIVEAADAPLTRKEIGAALAERGVELKGMALGHVTMGAELDKVVTTGPRRGSWDTFVPYASRIPASDLDRDEALVRLASMYLAGHAPATARDFAWWAGLTLTDARRAFEQVEPEAFDAPTSDGTTFLLSLFDELVIAYQDRSHYEVPTARDGVIDVWGGNLALIDGVVAATWRRLKPTRKADPVLLEITPVRALSPTDRERIESDAASLIDHLDTTVDLQWKDAS